MTDPRSPIHRDRTFVTMWLAIFLSAVSAFLLLMTLSALVFQRSGSAFMANVVVLTQWAPAVLARPLIRWLVRRHAPRTVLVGAEVGGAALLILLPATMVSYPALVAILLIRGTFESLSKVARTGAVKRAATWRGPGGSAPAAAARRRTRPPSIEASPSLNSRHRPRGAPTAPRPTRHAVTVAFRTLVGHDTPDGRST